MSEEFGRVRELCAAFGTDLGVVLLTSITWGEDKEKVWVMRLCWITEALRNGQPRNLRLGLEDKILLEASTRLDSLVVPRHPVKGGVGGLGRALSEPPPSPLPLPSSGPRRVGMDVKLGPMCRIRYFYPPT